MSVKRGLNQKIVQKSVGLPQYLWDKIEETSKLAGISQSQVIRRFIVDYTFLEKLTQNEEIKRWYYKHLVDNFYETGGLITSGEIVISKEEMKMRDELNEMLKNGALPPKAMVKDKNGNLIEADTPPTMATGTGTTKITPEMRKQIEEKLKNGEL